MNKGLSLPLRWKGRSCKVTLENVILLFIAAWALPLPSSCFPTPKSYLITKFVQHGQKVGNRKQYEVFMVPPDVSVVEHVTMATNEAVGSAQNNVTLNGTTTLHEQSPPSDLWENLTQSSSTLSDWLLQYQKEEVRRMEEQMAESNMTTGASAPEDLMDEVWHRSSATKSEKSGTTEEEFAQPELGALSPMNKETANELDDSVTLIKGNIAQENARTLPISEQYYLSPPARRLASKAAATATAALEHFLPSLSRRDHYEARIGRDIRNVAVEIASTIDNVDQWKLFCEDKGGIRPLLDCVMNHDDGRRASLVAASVACRTLRDLCTLSPEVPAILTDEMLRAHVEWNGDDQNEPALLERMVSLLERHHQKERLASRRRIQPRLRQKARQRSRLHILQLMLEMAVASDNAIDFMRQTPGLKEAIVECSSYACTASPGWRRFPSRVWKTVNRGQGKEDRQYRKLSLPGGIEGEIQSTANRLLAAIGWNKWFPKTPGQKGLRILALDGGGSRGMVAAATLRALVNATDGLEVCDSFDMIAGTSTGAIIAFLLGLRRETAAQVTERYNKLIRRIFVKSPLASALMILTTAQYNEMHFLDVMKEILGDNSMLDSRADPTIPLVFGVTSKMSSNPTHVAVLRNYNYNGEEMPDSFTVNPDEARRNLGLTSEFPNTRTPTSQRRQDFLDNQFIRGTQLSREASRHPGSFRPLQRHALRASTAATTVFKPVLMAGEMYCDGGIVASNPTAIAIHEARTLFPDVPIELVISLGTGGFIEEKTVPKGGWVEAIMQIVNSALDGELTHHLLEDFLGDDGIVPRHLGAGRQTMRYFRLNPVIGGPNDFKIDETEPEELSKLNRVTEEYMALPDQQAKLKEISDILHGRKVASKERSGFLSWIQRS